MFRKKRSQKSLQVSLDAGFSRQQVFKVAMISVFEEPKENIFKERFFKVQQQNNK